MGRKILFSPIGGTDPIKYSRDGSMLHICRHYQPDVVYLYISYEMLLEHKKDNRYVYAIEKLGEHLGHSFDVRVLERPEMKEAHEYDVFYQDFKDEIEKIEKEMEPGDELLLNMSSGTPAMKSALSVIAAFAGYRYRVIQVSSPQHGINSEHEDRSHYDKETECELNEDNLEGENRCKEVKCLNLLRMIKVEIIKKHVLAYDYTAAFALASSMEHELSGNARTLLEIADARIKLNQRKISKLMQGKPYDIYPIKEGDKQKIFEYALVLDLKIKKQEYADFVRGITPLVVDVLELILKNRCGIKLKDCCFGQGKDENPKWDRAKLKKLGLLECLEKEYQNRGGFREGPVYSSQIAVIIRDQCKDAGLSRKIDDIVAVEGSVRNIAAHEIVSVTDEWIKERAKKNARQIYELIQYLIQATGIHAKKEDWQSYDKMNANIIRSLAESAGGTSM